MLEHITEKELIDQCIAENRVYQKALFDKYSGKMMTVCLRYARDNQEAEDFLQEGFLKIFNSLNSFNFKGSFEGWMRRIIVNTTINKISKKRFTKERDDIEDYLDKTIEYPEALSNLSVEEILKLINKLPKGYKIVFNLYAVEGYSHKEISRMLGIREVSSRSQLRKARKILQKDIEQMKKSTI